MSPSKSPKFSQQGHVTCASIAKQEGHLGAGFSLGLSHTGMEHRVADLSYSVSSHSGGQTDRTWPKNPTINDIVSIDYVTRLKAPGNPRLSLLLGKTILSFQVTSHEYSQPVLSLPHTGFGHPSLLSSPFTAQYRSIRRNRARKTKPGTNCPSQSHKNGMYI